MTIGKFWLAATGIRLRIYYLSEDCGGMGESNDAI